MSSVTPFLMFEGAAEPAMRLYSSLFANAEVVSLERYGPGEQGAVGTIKRATLVIAGKAIRFFDSPVHHAFTFTPANSLFVECESEAEIQRVSTALLEGGTALMPLGSYGFSRQFVWLNDRFGVSWQLNLA